MRIRDDGPSVCLVPDCGRPRVKNGWCGTHAKRLRVHGDVMADVPIARRRDNGPHPCTVIGCPDPAAVHGLCWRHRQRVIRRGR